MRQKRRTSAAGDDERLSVDERVRLAWDRTLEKLGVTELPPMERKYSYPPPTSRRRKRPR